MKDTYIAARERWARKMAGHRQVIARSSERLPPGQRLVHNFPVLDLDLRPEIALDKWELKIHGPVENPLTLSWQQFLDRHILGFWEVRGYSNTADPWTEDRFANKDQIPPVFP